MSEKKTFVTLVEDEAERSGRMHNALANHHEALEVLAEEVHEVMLEVYKSSRNRKDEDLLSELIQTATMTLRWAVDRHLFNPDHFAFLADSALIYDLNMRGNPSSDHEALSRLRCIMQRLQFLVWGPADPHASHEPSSDLHGDKDELRSTLVWLYANCRRWAEWRGLVASVTPDCGIVPLSDSAHVAVGKPHVGAVGKRDDVA